MDLKGEMIELISGDGATIDIYSTKAVGERKGGLIVIHDGFGLIRENKETCDFFAAEGFDVLGPSFFARQGLGLEGNYSDDGADLARKWVSNSMWDEVQLDVQMCINQLKDKGPVFLTGFCYGGTGCWIAACRCNGLTAVSSYYGSSIKDFLDETPKCPINLHFGRQDPYIPLVDIEKIQKSHSDVPIYLYDTGHSFSAHGRPGSYHEASAKIAHKRTLELFESAGGY